MSLALLLLAVAGCSSKSETAPLQHPSACDNSIEPFEAYVAGITKMDAGGKIQVRLVDALPAPPDLGDNKWTVQVLDAMGKPRSGSLVTQVRPWMPNHGHGSHTLFDLGKVDADGKLAIDKLGLVMPGVWTVQICVDGQAKEQAAKFAFCVEG